MKSPSPRSVEGSANGSRRDNYSSMRSVNPFTAARRSAAVNSLVTIAGQRSLHVLSEEFCVMDDNEDQLINLATVALSIIAVAGIVAMLVYFDMP
jgi:hypothetical protein